MVARRPPILCAFVACSSFPHPWAAELPVIRLDTVNPPGGKAGSEVEVGITGADLDEAKELHFSNPGITAEPKDKRFVVKIAPNVPPGIYDVRATGLLGISNPRAFVVGDLPQTTKTGANSTPETAIELPVDSVIAGATTASAADYFKFTAKKGQRVLADCDAAELDSRLSPVLTFLDGAGHELGTSRRGGLLDFVVPADGTYLLKVHDLAFAGGADYFYRVALTTAPHIDFVLPPSGKPGEKGKFTLYGRNLPGGVPANVKGDDGQPLDKVEAEIDVPTAGDPHVDGLSNPAAAAVDGFSYRLSSPHASNAVFIGFANEPVVVEHEPNSKPGEAQKLTPPCEVAGQFFPAGDADFYTFDAKKGDVWWIETISQRLDLPTNPFVLIQRDTADVQEAYGADTNVGGIRFSTASNDPVVRFEAKEDGTYRVKVSDLFGNSRNDPRNVYRLIIRKESPDFRLVALAEPPPEKKDDRKADPYSTLLRADGTNAIKVVALRRDGFGGEIELHVEGLPAGVTCQPTKIAAGATEGIVLLTSCEKPERWAGSIRVIGKAKVGDKELTCEARGGAVAWTVADANVDAVRPRLTREIALAVSAAEPAPVSVAATEDKRWEIPAGGKIEIPLKVTRRGEFKEALKLKPTGAPGLEAAKEIDVAAGATTTTATIDLAAAKIPSGEYTVYFQAQTKGKFRGKDATTTIYSAPIRLAVQPASPKQP
ncbi:MAG TPA: PPC domain-containing protein [Chthoniobacter sp.]|nr:PPC domain-containing protein [Chthoniobacter sp.]